MIFLNFHACLVVFIQGLLNFYDEINFKYQITYNLKQLQFACINLCFAYKSIVVKIQLLFVKYINTIMTNNLPNIPSSLVEWVQQLGLENQFTQAEVESGRAVGKIMKAVVPDYNLQLLGSNSAVNRVSNWNNLITELRKIGIRVSQDQKTKIINGNHDVVYQILVRLHDFYSKNQKQTEVDISKINPKSEVGDSSSLLQLFILTIMKYFNLSSKQSVALLSSECKYLAHILVKGLKGQFKPIQGFLSELIKHVQIINGFCKNKQNEIFFIRAIKPSLISKSDIAAEKGMNLLQQFLNPLSNRNQIVKQHFLSTLVLAIRRHPHLIQQIIKFATKTTGYSKQLLVMFKSQATEVQMQNILLSLLNISKQRNQLNQFFELKGLNQIINKSIQNIKNSESAVSSLNLLLILSADNTQLLSDPDRGSKFIEYIQQVTISKKSDSIVFIQQLFSFLQIFGKDKNQLAPALFKILISKYQSTINTQQSRSFIENFRQIIQQFPTIPFSLIIDTMNSRLESNTLTLSQVQLQFFKDVMVNDTFDVKSALVIYNVVSKLLVEEPAFVVVCTDILLTMIRKFSNEAILVDLTIKLIKVCLAIHFANVKRLSVKRRSVTGTTKIDSEDAVFKSKNYGMEQFIYRITQQGLKDINKSSEPLICYSLIQVEHLSKQNGVGLRKIVSLFGNPADIIHKYQAQAKKLEQEQLKKQQTKKSKLKQSTIGGGTKNRYGQSPTPNLTENKQRKNRSQSHVSSDDGLRQSKLKNKLEPMLLSSLGVTPAAMKGLEKYQKSYLSKIAKIQQEQTKKKEEEERQIYLKKVFERKMMQKGIEVKAFKDDQFRYIYDFGVKQKQIQMDTVKNTLQMPLYNPDDQQDRDSKALQYAIKKYQRILKVYFNVYSGHNKPQNLDSFDKIAEKVNLLYSANLWKMLKQHGLDQFISSREVQYLCKKINNLLGKKFDDMTALDYQGFQNFITQSSFSMFTRPPKDLRGRPVSEMIQQTISHLKLYASENKINEKLFEDPDNVFYNETEALKQLNKKLEDNPDYILPEGYKKITDKKVIFTHRIFLDAMSEPYKDVYEIIDQILNASLGVHVIQPFTTFETYAKARPTLYYKQRQQGQINSQKISAFIKKQVAKMPIKDREIGKQVAIVLDEIVQAVQFGHDKIGQKYQNKLIREKKQQQQQIAKRMEEEKRKFADRNRQVKSALVKHKEVISQKQKQQKEKKQQEKRKLQQQKKKKQEQEQRLKNKVEGYQNKKKQDEQRRKKQQAQRKKKQKQDMQRKKKQSEQTKRKIQQIKQQKQEQQKQKKKQEQAAQKQRKALQKKKMQQEQRKKKQKIEQYKNKKTGAVNQSQVHQNQPEEQNQSQIKAVDPVQKLGSNIERKKIV